MFILLNGAFGIGKTTVATLLVREVPNAGLSDPERVGYVLRRLPAWLLGMARQPDDYQDLVLWRRLAVRGALGVHRRSPVVVVPMAFTNLGYLDELASRLGEAAPVHRFCLIASAAVVEGRLQGRAEAELRDVSEFERRRSRECLAVHDNAAFGTPVDAAPPPRQIVAEIRRLAGI